MSTRMSMSSAEKMTPLFELARRAGDGAVPDDVHRRGKEQLLTSLAASRVLPARRPWLLMAAAAVLAIAVVAIVAWPDAALDYSVEGTTVADSGYLAPDAPATVTFSDGTTCRLEASARARIAEVTARGAHIVLERGHATLSVVHRPSAAWLVEAGPYTIEVTGTAFSVEWSADEQRLVVEMESGSVMVRGALARDGVALHAGERLVVGGGELRIEALAKADVQPPKAPVAQTSATPAAPSAAPSATPSKSWSQRVAGGEFDAVVREAEARGIPSVLRSASLDELTALADAARYLGRNELARGALTAQRSRFAGSRQAATAAFLLGRMADEAGTPDQAIGFYEAHLAEGGAFATEALGRKMLAEQKAGRSEAAKRSARLYLERHPNGPHAAAARALAP